MATPLTKDRNTPHKAMTRRQAYPVAAATIIYKGALVALNAAGDAIPAINTAGFIVVGIADHQVDNSGGAAGDLSVVCMRGSFSLNGEGGDLPTAALLGRPVYAASDNEVEATAGAGAVIAGILEEIDGAEYWVSIFDQA